MFVWQIVAASNCTKLVGLHVKCPIFLSDFNQISCFSTDIHKVLNIKFYGNPSSESRLSTWIDERDEASRIFLWQCELFFFNFLSLFPTDKSS